MTLVLSYGHLDEVIRYTKNLSNSLNEYCDDLCDKVQKKLLDVEGGGSSHLENAGYYVKRKMEKIRQRKANADTMNTLARNLLDTAKRVDSSVKSMIEARQAEFFEKYPDLKPSNFKMMQTSFLCDLRNVPVLGWIIKGVEAVGRGWNDLGKNIRHWWKCGGGQEIVMNAVDIVVKVGLAVVAVAVAVSAVAALAGGTVIAIVVAGAALVAAAIACVNAVTNTITSVRAIAAGGDDPAMAKIYGKQDSLSTVLRETNFRDWGLRPITFQIPFSGGMTYTLDLGRILNRKSMEWATEIEIADNLASLILIADAAWKAGGTLVNKLDRFAATNGIDSAFKVTVQGSNGATIQKVTPQSLWDGFKAFVMDKPPTSGASQGVRTILLDNLKSNAGTWVTQVKNDLRHPIPWFRSQQAAGKIPTVQSIRQNLQTLPSNLKQYVQNLPSRFQQGWTQFANASRSDKLLKAGAIAKKVNIGISSGQSFVEGIYNVGDRNLIDRGLERFFRTKVFSKNSTVQFLNTSGIGGVMFGNNLKNLTGISQGGVIQKTFGIFKKSETPSYTSSSLSRVWDHYNEIENFRFTFDLEALRLQQSKLRLELENIGR